MARILIAGCGDVGSALGAELVQSGHFVVGLKRTPPASCISVDGLDVDERTGIHFIQADLTQQADLAGLDTHFDQVVYIVTPSTLGEAGYRAVFDTGLANLLNVFKNKTPRACFTLTSSTSVYGQSQGEEVDESSDTKPANYRGQYQLLAEQQVLAHSTQNTVVRFSGIYGPGRYRLLKNAEKGSEIQREPHYYTNRIHRDDCVGVLLFLLEKKLAVEQLQPIYLASDDHPEPNWNVMCWLAEQLKSEPPKPKEMLDGASQNKRCCNLRLKKLGYRFKYSGYHQGYLALINEYLLAQGSGK